MTTNRASVAGAVGFQRATGINSVAGPGDKDGYRNFSGRLRGDLAPARQRRDRSLGARPERPHRVRRLRLLHRRPCRHARQQPQPPRGRADLGDRRQRCFAVASAGRRHPARLVEQEFISTTCSRTARVALAAICRPRSNGASATGAVTHRLIVAGETEHESFHARDTAFGGFTNQDRTRRHESITAEWRGDAKAIDRRRRGPPRHVSTASAMRPASALPCSDRSAADFRSPVPMHKALRSRPSSTCTGSSPAISSAIPISGRKARAGSSFRCVIAAGPSELR